METKHVLSFIFLQWIINTEVVADEGSSASSRSVFFITKENIRLKGHTVKRFESPSLLTCSHLCLRNEWCTSTNYKLSSKNGDEGTCELNKYGISLINEKAVFQEQEDVTFSMSFKHPCQRNPCRNNGECVPDDFTRNTYHCVCKTGFAGTHCKDYACKFDFEDGTDGWEKSGTVFNNQPTYGDNPAARNRGQPANQQGDWWIGGYENRSSQTAPAGSTQGDGPQGYLTSSFFTIRGQNISFLIGGGCDMNSVRAELIIDDQVVRNETGNCSETMTYKTWDVTDFIGQRARVRLVDFSSGGWGHINFDDLKGDISCGKDES